MARGQSRPKEIVVVGAGYAGMVAALRCSRPVPRRGDQVHVTVVNPTDRFVERVRLHQRATGQPLRAISVSQLLRGRPAHLQLGWATSIDPVGGRVTVRSADGDGDGDGERSLGYDLLVYAAGSAVDLDAVPGVREHAHSLADLLSAERFFAALASAREGQRVVVCGGGATGVEAASEVADAFPHLRVSLVTRGEPGGWLSVKARRHIAEALARRGVAVVEQSEVRAVDLDRVELTAGDRIPFDLCLWAGPFTVPKLAAGSGIACDEAGRIVVDAHLRSASHPNVVVAGDAALARCPDGAPTRMACATAMPMGAQAAEVALAELAGGSAPSFQNRYLEQCLSLGRHDGVLQGLDQHDSPSGPVIVGRPARWGKELIVRSTVWSLHVVRRYPGTQIPGFVPRRQRAPAGAADPPTQGGRPDVVSRMAATAVAHLPGCDEDDLAG